VGPGLSHRIGYLIAIQTVLALKLSAQIITDGSMGAAMNLSGPNFQIPETLGTRAGANLFHSFQTFNLSQGQRATFTGETGIQNLVARVTGGAVSNIDGTLASEIPGANLYFMNPAGVMFGPNAQLELSGSFAVTTADQIEFAAGSPFGSQATLPVTLTSAAPVAFGFLGNNPKSISFNGSRLEVGVGHQINIVGGALDFRNSADISAPSGNLLLASVGSSGSLDLANPVTGHFANLGDITLTGGAWVRTSGESAGNLLVRGGNLTIAESTPDRFTSLRNETSGRGNGGTINIELRGNLTQNNGNVVAQNREAASGTGSDVSIVADGVFLENKGRIITTTFGNANGGRISINASKVAMSEHGSSSEDGNTGIRALTFSNGDAGDIKIIADEINVSANASISSFSGGRGMGGNIDISTGHIIVIDGSIGGVSTSDGNSGRISIAANFLDMSEASIRASSRNSGAGDIAVEVGEMSMLNSTVAASGMSRGGVIQVWVLNHLAIDGSYNDGVAIQTSTRSSQPVGDAGGISIRSGSMSLLNGAFVGSVTTGFLDAGDITVSSDGHVVIDGGVAGILTGFGASSGSSAGDSGSISLRVGGLNLLRGGVVRSTTDGQGNSGSISLITTGNLLIDGGPVELGALETGIYSHAVGKFIVGNGGDVTVTAGEVSILNRGQISSQSFGFGNAGSVFVNVEGDLLIDGIIDTVFETGIAARANQGRTGDINVNAGSLSIARGGIIDNSVLGTGSSGRVVLEVQDRVEIDGGGFRDLQAGVFSGRPLAGRPNRGASGDILIYASGLSLVGGGVVSSESRSGDAGSVEVVTRSGSIEIDGSNVSVAAPAGSAGRVSLSSAEDIIAAGSTISASAQGDGGNVALAGRFIRAENGTRLIANAVQGRGGAFTLESLLFMTPNSPFPRVDSQQGQAGSVDVRNVVDIQSSLAQLPEGVLSDQFYIQLGCERDRPYASSLEYGSLQGVLASPSLWFPSSHLERYSPQ